jgi:hypothetical protein
MSKSDISHLPPDGESRIAQLTEDIGPNEFGKYCSHFAPGVFESFSATVGCGVVRGIQDELSEW